MERMETFSLEFQVINVKGMVKFLKTLKLQLSY